MNFHRSSALFFHKPQVELFGFIYGMSIIQALFAYLDSSFGMLGRQAILKVKTWKCVWWSSNQFIDQVVHILSNWTLKISAMINYYPRSYIVTMYRIETEIGRCVDPIYHHIDATFQYNQFMLNFLLPKRQTTWYFLSSDYFVIITCFDYKYITMNFRNSFEE